MSIDLRVDYNPVPRIQERNWKEDFIITILFE